jgi:flagellar hook-basal body complex protein FliE
VNIEAIQGISANSLIQSSAPISPIEGDVGPNIFANLIMDKLNQVNEHIGNSSKIMEQYILTNDVPVHDVMIAMGKAKSELQLMVEVRNKLLEAYQEIVRIQV